MRLAPLALLPTLLGLATPQGALSAPNPQAPSAPAAPFPSAGVDGQDPQPPTGPGAPIVPPAPDTPMATGIRNSTQPPALNSTGNQPPPQPLSYPPDGSSGGQPTPVALNSSSNQPPPPQPPYPPYPPQPQPPFPPQPQPPLPPQPRPRPPPPQPQYPTHILRTRSKPGDPRSGLYVVGFPSRQNKFDLVLTHDRYRATRAIMTGNYEQFLMDSGAYGLVPFLSPYLQWGELLMVPGPGSPGWFVNFNGQLVFGNDPPDSFLACDWWHGRPQLFYAQPTAETIPTCSRVTLIMEPA
ncbi:hypothetical protein GX50_01303 [[Emmonsia] crescens]|uniref:DUF7907 domain-containing protein n=1 Tax=[Emmonsia] crescens TaxID=73230 RepID=A0A2B7ZQA6_9EURO|nr:hypothetical protein GX50_01303 [Emmonsia crescens]